MGKPKTQRTDELHQAARRYTVAKQAEQAIEQHNFNRLVETGLIVRDTEKSLLGADKGYGGRA